ncbi:MULTISPECIES: hydrolase [Microbacterium]|uniref:hydrolase n=1 Tax=Microbacterium TaxID=33882 RepID=UPI00217EEAA1|nr:MULTISPECIES: hydrolase [Microbacterium]UWF77261.1 hydrolase [Microbacterium neungamense]WCM55418.1 hydrolase [Microbacterium sp. EF45047]
MSATTAGIRAVAYFDGRMLREGVLAAGIDGTPRLAAGPAPADAARLDGLVTGRFTDHHVHLQLVDHTLLPDSRLGRVIDLGANVDRIREIAAEHPAVRVEYAGPFLTAMGGYPSDRAWAPEGAVHEITDAEGATATVAALAAAGVSCLKTVGNSDAGPVLDDALLRLLAGLAADHDLPLVAHAEGAGQAQRVARLGASRLAHAPFTERLTDDEIAAQAASVSWISTMAIHEGEAYAHVVDNVRRFHAAGGMLVYGSDMGNGPTPVDLRDSEVAALREAGVDGLDLLRALAPEDPLGPASVLLLLPDGDPARARRLTPADLGATHPFDDAGDPR